MPVAYEPPVEEIKADYERLCKSGHFSIMSSIVLEEPVRIKYLIKTNVIETFNKTVDDVMHNRLTQLYQGGNSVNGMRDSHFWYDMDIVSIDPEEGSFNIAFPGRSRPIIYNDMTAWDGFYVEFADGKKFMNLGIERSHVKAYKERNKFFEYVKHYIDMPEEYIELDDIVM